MNNDHWRYLSGEDRDNARGRALENYDRAYAPRFLQDCGGASAEYDAMSRASGVYRRWWEGAETMVQAAGLGAAKEEEEEEEEEPIVAVSAKAEVAVAAAARGLETVDQFMSSIKVGDDDNDDDWPANAMELIDKVFDRIWETRVRHLFEGSPRARRPEEEAGDVRQTMTMGGVSGAPFARYMLGQFVIFARYDFLSVTGVYETKLRDFLLERMRGRKKGRTVGGKRATRRGGIGPPPSPRDLTYPEMRCAMDLYRSYLHVLQSNGLLTSDDVKSYSAAYPPLGYPVYYLCAPPHHDYGWEGGRMETAEEDLHKNLDKWREFLDWDDDDVAGTPVAGGESSDDDYNNDNGHNSGSERQSGHTPPRGRGGGRGGRNGVPKYSRPPPAHYDIIGKLSGGLRVMDCGRWCASVSEIPVSDRLRCLLQNCGVPFWSPGEIRRLAAESNNGTRDGGGKVVNKTHIYLVKSKPVVALTAVGGVPIRMRREIGKIGEPPRFEFALAPSTEGSGEGISEGRVEGEAPPLSTKSLQYAFRTSMAHMAYTMHLNPKNLTPDKLFDTLIASGVGERYGVGCPGGRHSLVGHACSVSFVLAGHSLAAEREFNSRGGLVHLSGLMTARDYVQSNPPIVVPSELMLGAYLRSQKSIREEIRRFQSESVAADDAEQGKGGERASHMDVAESLHMLWPSAKAHVAVVSGTLRNFQLLMEDIDDPGLGTEYRLCLWEINQNLHAIAPDIFRGTNSFKWSPPRGG